MGLFSFSSTLILDSTYSLLLKIRQAYADINKLFQKLVENTIIKEEFEELMKVIKDSGSRHHIKEMMDRYLNESKNYKSDSDRLNKVDSETLYDLILTQIEEDEENKESSSTDLSLTQQDIFLANLMAIKVTSQLDQIIF